MGHISRLVPILFKADETTFTHNGLGRLSDATKCEVTEVLNGEFELMMTYPVNGSKYSLIEEQMLILAKPNPYDDPHLFRIYEHNLSSNENSVEIHARSNTADLADNLVTEVTITEKTPAQAMTTLGSVAIDPCDFLFISDIVTQSSVKWERRNLLSCIAGQEDSIIQIWGGEIQHGNKTIAVYQRRGTDTDVTIRHGRNLRGLTVTYSTQGIVTAILPYTRLGTDEDGNEQILIGSVVRSAKEPNYPHAIIKDIEFPLDQYGTEVITVDPDSGHETTTIVMTLSDLNTAAANWFTENPDMDVPSINIEVEIENLSQTEDYAQFKAFETLRLGDTITVWAEKYNVELTARVVKVVYDCLSDKNLELEVGRVKETGFQAYQKSIYNTFVKPVANRATYAQTAANQKNRVFRGTTMPSSGMKYNDLWYKPVGEGEIELYRYDGLVWNLEKVSGGLIQGVLDANSGDLDIINLNASNISTGTLGAQFVSLTGDDTLETVLDNFDGTLGNLLSNYTSLKEDLEGVDGFVQILLGSTEIGPAQLLSLRTLLETINKEVEDLTNKAPAGSEALTSTLVTSAGLVTSQLEYLLDEENYVGYNFNTLGDLYASYLSAANAVKIAINDNINIQLTNLEAGRISLSSRVKNYENVLVVTSSSINMNVGGDVAMALTPNDLRFIGDKYETVIAKNEWKILKDNNKVMSITEDEIRIPKAISSEYFGIGRIKILPSKSSGTIIGTDIVFLDDPAGLEG